MSKWRPSKNCMYVIPDIHGMASQLKLILSRILPLRNTGGSFDKVCFLGDYIDRRIESPQVIDIVSNLRNKYPNQVFCIKGNHELLLLNAIKPIALFEDYKMWMSNGGEDTLIGYLRRANSRVESPYMIRREMIHRFIPKDHMDFFNSLLPYYETDDYIFVHGGCDPMKPVSEQKPRVLAWDRSVYYNMLHMAENGGKCPWEKTIVTGHNGDPGGKPFVYDKFMMLDGSYADILYVWELNSMTGFSARHGNKRLVKESIP